MHRLAKLLGFLALALPLGLTAQSNLPPDGTNAPRSNPDSTSNVSGEYPRDSETQTARRDRLRDSWGTFSGPEEGDFEFTFGGGGSANSDVNSSSGGVSSSFGLYFTENLLLAVRQSIDYSNPDGGDSGWGASTRVALDQHIFTSGRLRPFVGVNAGLIYGDGTDDSLIAGLETGLKFYIQPRAFVFALVEYAWTFEDAEDADNNFDQGGFRWTLGIGLNF